MQFFSPVSRVFTNLRQAVSEFVEENQDNEGPRLTTPVAVDRKYNNLNSDVVKNERKTLVRNFLDEIEEVENSSRTNSCISEPVRITPDYGVMSDSFDESRIIYPDRETPTLIEENEEEFDTDSQHYATIYENNINKSEEENSDLDRVDRLWNSTENKLHQKEEDLLKIKEMKLRLDANERSLSDWMNESENKLNFLLSEGVNAENERMLKDIKGDIPNWQKTLNVHQSLTYELSNTVSLENCQEMEDDLERLNRHWSVIINKLEKCCIEPNVIKTSFEQSGQNLEEEAEMSLPKKQIIRKQLSTDKLSGWLSSLEGQLETAEMGIARWRSGSGSIGTTNSEKLKLKIIAQLDDLENEIMRYEDQFKSCSDSERNESDYNISVRWKILKEKVNEIRKTLGDTPESGQQLLTKLRLLNDWLAHKDAELLEHKQSPSNNYTLSQNLLRVFGAFLIEMESRRSQIEDTIEQTQNRIGEAVDLNMGFENSNAFSLESEGESDNSDNGSNTNTSDEKGKRLIRRLRRHCHHLKRKWVEIRLKSKTFNETLKRRVELLNSIESQIKESQFLLSEIEFHIDSWIQISTINSSLILQEMAKMKTLLQSAEHITDRINSVDPLRNQLQKLQAPLCQDLIDEIEKIKSRIAIMQSLCETRQHQLRQHEIHSTKDVTVANKIPNMPVQDVTKGFLNSSSKNMASSRESADNRKFTEFGNESVSYPWERCLHPSGSEVPYYKNHSTQDTQWDHPIMTELTKSFDELNAIRFSAYRTAMKLRALQRTLCMDLIDLNLVTETLRLSGLQSATVNERLLDVGQIIIFLASLYRSLNQRLNKSIMKNGSAISDKSSSSILGCTRSGSIRSSRARIANYHTRSSSFGGFKSEEEREDDAAKIGCIKSPSTSSTPKHSITKCPSTTNMPTTRNLLTNCGSEINIPVCVDLALNWLLNVYDSARNGKIRVLSLKVAVVIMSNVYLDEKYKYLFSLICNNLGQVDSTRLTFLLTDCILLPKLLNESSSFGTETVEPSVLSCFKYSIESNAGRFIRLNNFLSWLKLEPQSLVWLPVLHRLISAEYAVHQAKCGVCKIQPIVGLRYRCLRCFNFDLCQTCFFYSKTGRGHKVSHPMQEYCNVTSSKESIRDYSRIIRNRFRSKKCEPKLGYLPVQSIGDQDQTVMKMHMNVSLTPNLSTINRQIHSRVEIFANRLAEVEHLNRSHFCEKESYTHPGMNSSMQCHDSARMIKELNRNDEEHLLIAKYAETLRYQIRNEVVKNYVTSSKNLFSNATLQKLDMKEVNDVYASIPISQSASMNQRFQGELNHVSSMGSLCNQTGNHTTDMRFQNGQASLNQLIKGLETQKIQLLDEYERLQSQTPVNCFSISKGSCSLTNQGPRCSTTDLVLNNSNRGDQFSPGVPLSPSRTTDRSYGAFSGARSFDFGDVSLTSTDLVSEARMLREHKGKLESRMGLLEQRNRQLETQLNMLRQLIDDPSRNKPIFRPTSNNIINSLMSNNYQDSEMLTAAQYAVSKRINDISCGSPHSVVSYPNNYFPLSSDSKAYPYQSGVYSGPNFSTSQRLYGSLERESSNQNTTNTTDAASGYRTNVDQALGNTASNLYQHGQLSKVPTYSGGSLADSNFQKMSNSSLDSCPVFSDSPTNELSSNEIGSLFQMAGQVGKAVGQLVNVMTDEFTNGQTRSSTDSTLAFHDDVKQPISNA